VSVDDAEDFARYVLPVTCVSTTDKGGAIVQSVAKRQLFLTAFNLVTGEAEPVYEVDKDEENEGKTKEEKTDDVSKKLVGRFSGWVKATTKRIEKKHVGIELDPIEIPEMIESVDQYNETIEEAKAEYHKQVDAFTAASAEDDEEDNDE